MHGNRHAGVSYQFIHEFFNVALKLTSSKMSSAEANLFIADVFRPMQIVPSSIPLVSGAVHIQERYRLGWYDSLNVSAGQQAGCSILHSEGLQHGHKLVTVTVRIHSFKVPSAFS